MNLPTLGNTNVTRMGCEDLSDHDRALSSIISAFTGSAIGGLTGGFFVAFFTGCVCWLATFRILCVGVWAAWEAIRLRPAEGGDQFDKFYSFLPPIPRKRKQQATLERQMSALSGLDDPLKASPPTFFGWAGWVFVVFYAPVSQGLWIAANLKQASVGLRVARAIGVAVTALPLTIDTKARYGVALKKRWGRWSRCTFSLLTAISCLLLGVFSALLLISAARHLELAPAAMICFYIVFSIAWTLVSFSFQRPEDATRSPNTVQSVLAGLLMGVFAGVFVSARALAVMGNSSTSGSTLKQYLGCQSVIWWHKFTSFFP